MVLVRLVFQAKWGQADEVVEEFKRSADVMRKVLGADIRIRILTDLSGPFHTVVQELEVESMGEFEKRRAKLFTSPEFQEMQSERGETPFLSGSAEFYKIEASY